MKIRAALVLALAAALIGSLGACRSAPEGPAVVGGTPGQPEPTATPAPTPLEDLAIALEPVASGFEQPLFVTGAGDGSDRLFVVEKTGRVWILRGDRRGATPFLDVSDRVSSGSEQGLLGIAFPPDYAETQVVWADYTRADGTTVVSSFHAEGDITRADDEYVWLTVSQPYANHNGGMVVFGPDKQLYVGLGDGGSGGDPHGNGQNLGALLGKILRLNVLFDGSEVRGTVYGIPTDNPFATTAGARGEIWAYGLRNPWRFSFDRATDDLWIADVGQDQWEEVDFQPASSKGGENYGWNRYEGTHVYPPLSAPADASGLVMPVIEYNHPVGNSITGGYVYRGTAQPSLWGTYFYADFVSGRIWGAQRSADGTVKTRELLDTEALVSSFGEDDAGELHVVDFNGTVYRLTEQSGQ